MPVVQRRLNRSEHSGKPALTRYAIVGCGNRALNMFAKPLQRDYSHKAQLVAICDINAHRVNHYHKQLDAEPMPFTDFSTMLREARPDRVIVCTPDHLHDQFIVEALAFGCEQVISEKPITTDPEKLQRIFEAERKYKGRVIVTFNYRHSPLVSKVKELLAGGAIGEVTAANLEWFLDTNHGADYFRRWHADKSRSGGLQVHKSTHHFDLLNWWLDAEPREVSAWGGLKRYGKAGQFRGERCMGCEHAQQCPFYFELASHPTYKALYLDAEKEDGYIRDRCVFREDIDIEDTINASIRYDNTLASYSLVAYAPWEGWRASLAGSEGRIEVRCHLRWPYENLPADTIDIYQHDQSKPRCLAWDGPDRDDGGHGGGDVRLREFLFGDDTDDPLNIMADSRAGACSAGVGFAINHSLQSGAPVAMNNVIAI